jgi:hypothetical protein
MADPHSPITGALTGAGISSVTVVLGAQVDALVVGLVAAVFVSTWLESIDSRMDMRQSARPVRGGRGTLQAVEIKKRCDR